MWGPRCLALTASGTFGLTPGRGEMCAAVPSPAEAVGGPSPRASVVSGARVACRFDVSSRFGHVPNICFAFGTVPLRNQDGTTVTSTTGRPFPDQGLSVRLRPLSRGLCPLNRWGDSASGASSPRLVFYLPSF